MAGAKISSQSAENCAIVLFPNIKNIKQWEYNDLLYLFTNNLYMHSCQHLRLNCNQPAEPWSNNLCQSASLRFLTANSSMHRTELHLWQTHRHCVERSSSLCMPSFMKSSLASWRTRMTLRETAFSDQSRKFLLHLSGLFWSLCGSMLISLRRRSLPGFTDGPTRLRLPEQARTSRRMWTMSALPDCRATNTPEI